MKIKLFLIVTCVFTSSASVAARYGGSGILGLWGKRLGDKIDLNLTTTSVMGPMKGHNYVSVRLVEHNETPTIKGFDGCQSYYTPISGECWKIGAYYSKEGGSRADAETMFDRARKELERLTSADFKTGGANGLRIESAIKCTTASFDNETRFLVVSLSDMGMPELGIAIWTVSVELYCKYYMDKLLSESRNWLGLLT